MSSPTQYFMDEMGGDPNAAWMNIAGILIIIILKDLNRIDGDLMEVEWKIFPGFTTLGILEEIQKLMNNTQCEPEHFSGRIIFM